MSVVRSCDHFEVFKKDNINSSCIFLYQTQLHSIYSLLCTKKSRDYVAIYQHCVITKMISDSLLLYPGFGLALSRRSYKRV